MDSLNRQLQSNCFHFGYRVFDEIAQYLFNNHINGMMPFISAFDQAVLMKVLPKFTGSRARLRAPLLSLLAWTFSPDNPASIRLSTQQQFEALNPDNSAAIANFTANATFQVVANRATQMLLTLETDGFVSFG